jgi:pimeloyl-ACP methyl ester carboxylesterase
VNRVIRNPYGEKLDYSYLPGSDVEAPLFVIGHGVTANKDREWAILLAEAFAKEGYGSLRFSFSGNGKSEGCFKDSCPSKEVEDLGSVLDAVKVPVTYVGHSMGAAVGVLRAARDERIYRLISLGGMVDTAAFARRKFGDLIPGKDLMWDKPECPFSLTFKADMEQIGTVLPLAPRIQIPWLLVHGTEDGVVPASESELIAKKAGGPVQVDFISGGDHVFSQEFGQKMVDKVLLWLESAG